MTFAILGPLTTFKGKTFDVMGQQNKRLYFWSSPCKIYNIINEIWCDCEANDIFLCYNKDFESPVKRRYQIF